MDGRPALELAPDAPRTDAELLRAFFDGDAQAFTELVQRHHAAVAAVLRRQARSAADAQDLAQRAFLKLLEATRRHGALGHGVPVRAWLLRVAMNLGKNHARDEARHHRANLLVVRSADGDGPRPDQQLADAQRRAAVQRAVTQLPKRQREVFTLRVDLGAPFAEVAQVLGITENNAKVHFHHAVQRLKALVPEATGESP